MFYNQQTIELNKLYIINIPSPFNNLNMFFPTIFINGGAVDIYASGSNVQPQDVSDMILSSENSNISGYDSFYVIPKYIYITQKSGTTTEIIIGGINATDLGEFS